MTINRMEQVKIGNGRLRDLAKGSLLWLFVTVLTVGMTLILVINYGGNAEVMVEVGKPAPENVYAPRSIDYQSDILTAQAKDDAANAVETEYTPFDLSIRREQLRDARAIFAFVDVVRADLYANEAEKLLVLGVIEGVTIEAEVGKAVLALDTAQYEQTKTEIISTIDELMRREIRPDELSAVRRSARQSPNPDLTPTQETAVTNLAPQFIVANVFPNLEATSQKREEATAAIEPRHRIVLEGQQILQTGDIVTAEDVEILTELGLLRPDRDWRDIASLFMASLLSSVLITLYWQQFHREFAVKTRYLGVLLTITLFFTIAARVMVTTPALLYWYPIAAMSMLLAVIFETRLAIMITVVIASIVGFIAPNSLELVVYLAAGGIMSVLTLRDAQRVTAFFRAGLAGALGHVFVLLVFRLPQNVDVLILLQQIFFAVGNGILSAALTLVGFYILGSLFGVITILQLQDLSRLDHPLLQQLLRRAPGTYHHSLIVANLAEQAAERIGANSPLVRVGAFYHDVGKMNRPPFFTENQEGVNPHDSLDPYTSARIIASHVTDGLELARRYRLPHRIQQFIAEHHGQRLIKGFYFKAIEQAGGDESEVDKEKFRYAGPRPRTRESGIVMLADAVEATSSALRPNTEKAIEKLVNSLVDDDLMEGQLDDSGLTLGDLRLIRASFIETLKGRFHVRVKYPGNETLEEGKAVAALPAGDVVEFAETAVLPVSQQSVPMERS
ncbi:MAG: HDIG domain-containing protein [Anaerolineales bacterium]|nr:HDIG domain-containing protein [Anaerolineales bacterium]